MALTTCSECSGQVSTKASSCPHCGAPLVSPTHDKRDSDANLASHSAGRSPLEHCSTPETRLPTSIQYGGFLRHAKASLLTTIGASLGGAVLGAVLGLFSGALTMFAIGALFVGHPIFGAQMGALFGTALGFAAGTIAGAMVGAFSAEIDLMFESVGWCFGGALIGAVFGSSFGLALEIPGSVMLWIVIITACGALCGQLGTVVARQLSDAPNRPFVCQKTGRLFGTTIGSVLVAVAVTSPAVAEGSIARSVLRPFYGAVWHLVIAQFPRTFQQLFPETIGGVIIGTLLAIIALTLFAKLDK